MTYRQIFNELTNELDAVTVYERPGEQVRPTDVLTGITASDEIKKVWTLAQQYAKRAFEAGLKAQLFSGSIDWDEIRALTFRATTLSELAWLLIAAAYPEPKPSVTGIRNDWSLVIPQFKTEAPGEPEVEPRGIHLVN